MRGSTSGQPGNSGLLERTDLMRKSL